MRKITKKGKLRKLTFEREGEPDRMRLMERDRLILRKVWEYRLLTTSLLQLLAFSKKEGGYTALANVRNRLRDLYDNHLLERVITPLFPGEGRPEAVYCLGSEGRAYLETLGIPGGEPVLPSGPRKVPSYLEHELLVSKMMTLVEVALREVPQVILKPLDQGRVWYHERTLTPSLHHNPLEKYLTRESVMDPLTRRKLLVKPDAVFLFQVTEHQYERLFCLEVDRNSMGNTEILDKQLGYFYFLEKNLYRKFGETLQGFRVLFVTTRSERSLVTLRKEMKAFGRGYDLFSFARIEEITADSLLKKPIWFRSDDQKVSLING